MVVARKKSSWMAIFQYVLVLMILLSVFPRMFMGRNGPEWNRLTYYTIQTNLLMAAYWFMATFGVKQSKPYALFRFCCVVAITITGVLYFIFLHGGYAESLRNQYLNGKTTLFFYGYDLCITYLNHLIVPVFAMVDYLFSGSGWLLEKKHLPWPLAYPLVYFICHTIRGALTGFYNYDFINPAKSGWMNTLVTFLILLTFILILTLFYYGAGKRAGKRKPETERNS